MKSRILGRAASSGRLDDNLQVRCRRCSRRIASHHVTSSCRLSFIASRPSAPALCQCCKHSIGIHSLVGFDINILSYLILINHNHFHTLITSHDNHHHLHDNHHRAEWASFVAWTRRCLRQQCSVKLRDCSAACR